MDVVTEDELLYRRVPDEGKYFHLDEGVLRPSSQAFAERTSRPSVDRAKLRDNNPSKSQRDPREGVVSLLTKEVRQMRLPQRDEKGKSVLFEYEFDVLSAPIEASKDEPANPAHAEIVGKPEYSSEKAFRRVMECLAQMAMQRGWLIVSSNTSSTIRWGIGLLRQLGLASCALGMRCSATSPK